MIFSIPQRLVARALQRLCAVILLLAPFASCMDEEEYTTAAGDRLRFSRDTLQLDTIIGGEPSGTFTLVVHNPAGSALRIPRVHLQQGGASPFRVNVDGTFLAGGEASDFEVAAGDSLRVFLFARTPDTGQALPQLNEDKLLFTLESGVEQEVVLRAFSQSVETLTGLRVSGAMRLEGERPFRVMDSIVVERGGELTLAPGTRLFFHPDARLVVHGTLLAEGTRERRIVMRGDRLGDMFEAAGQSYDRIPAQWDGVTLTTESRGNRLSYCDVHSGVSGITCRAGDSDTEQLRLEHSIVHNMSGNCLTARGARLVVGNSQITNAGGDCVSLVGGDARFVHCTLANFYPFAGGRDAALRYTNYAGDERVPLQRAEFVNCIITGYAADNIMGNRSSAHPDDAFSFRFAHCLLGTPRTEGEEIEACLWDERSNAVWGADLFAPAFDLQRLIFTFTPAAESPVRGAAEPSASAEYPTDPLGTPRPAGTAADIGCYQYTSAE